MQLVQSLSSNKCIKLGRWLAKYIPNAYIVNCVWFLPTTSFRLIMALEYGYVFGKAALLC